MPYFNLLPTLCFARTEAQLLGNPSYQRHFSFIDAADKSRDTTSHSRLWGNFSQGDSTMVDG